MENSNLTQPALFPTIDKSTPSAVQSFLKVDGYRLVSSLQVRLPAALLPLWRDDAWLGRQAASEEEKAGEAKRYVMSARACGSMVKLFTHAVEPDPRVVDDDTATTTTSPPPDGSEGSPAEAAIAEMLRAPALRRVPGDVARAEENPPAAASAEASPKASTAPSATDATPVGDPSISLKSSSAAHYALKENFIAVLRDRVPALRKVDSGLDLPSDLTAAEVRKNAEDVGRDFISRCISLSKKGGQPTHCADVISRVAQNCNRVRLGVAEGQPSEAGDETVRLKTHVANLLHVVGVVTGEFVDEIKVAAEGEDSAPNALQCLSHVLAFLTNASERVRASLWKSGKAQVIIEGYCHYCEKKVNAGDDDKMADAHSWLETMVEESAMLARTEGEEEASAKEMPAWLTEASLAIEGLCDEPYIYTGDWDALQQRLLAAVVGILTVHEERRSPSDPLRLVAVMVPSPDLTRAALEVMSLLANREVNASAVFGSSPWKLLSLLSLRRSSSYPEITSMLASVLAKLLENKQFIAAVVDLALRQLNKESERKKKKGTAETHKKNHRHHHHQQQDAEDESKKEGKPGDASEKSHQPQQQTSPPRQHHLAYKLSDILANPMMKGLMLKDPHTVEEVLVKDLMKKRQQKAATPSTAEKSSTGLEDGEKEDNSVMVLLDTKDDDKDGPPVSTYLAGVSTAEYPYSILAVASEFLLRTLDLLSTVRRDSDDETPK
ncbi:hypothetical protein FOZ63_000507, partial [Perkinsus olseni]